MSKLRLNPFRPNSIVTPGMFQGRLNEILKIQDCLFQTKHGNPQHFIIEGERGIGKSSLLLAIDHFAKGDLKMNDEKFNFLVVAIELTGAMNSHDFLRMIVASLKAEIATKHHLQELAKSALEFLAKIEAMGVKFHRDDQSKLSQPFELIDEIANAIAIFLKSANTVFDGILFLIDEADKPEATANIGESLKLLTERMTKKGVERVSFGLAGLPILIDKLKSSHESSPRLFTIMSLAPLEPEERLQVLKIGLQQIKTKTSVVVEIKDSAANLISELSEGYPHFLQQFAYCALEEDSDNTITEDDVRNGAFKEHGALDQLGNKYFYDMYHSINSDDYRRVLQAMAEDLDAWISRADIIQRSKLKQETVDNALKALKNKGTILQNDSKRGEYRLPTKSFAAWIKATEQQGR